MKSGTQEVTRGRDSADHAPSGDGPDLDTCVTSKQHIRVSIDWLTTYLLIIFRFTCQMTIVFWKRQSVISHCAILLKFRNLFEK